jgi:predicted dehydrogenase
MRLGLAIVGTGYWGINHVRAFAGLTDLVELRVVCDSSDRNLAKASRFAPDARPCERYEDVLDDPEVQAVVLATPARLHATQAEQALRAGKHVFVEKPLALSTPDAERVIVQADSTKRVLMVGHLMLYHPAYERLRELVHSGEIGDVYYAYSLRVNLGRLRTDENALWSLGPHDVSMLLDLFGSAPVSVAARGGSYLQPSVQDVVFVNLTFADRRMAQIQLSWLDPRKERRVTVVGSRKMVEFDDAHPSEKLRIYDKGYDRPPTFTHYGEYLTIRQGDIHIPRVAMGEPLELECRHFAECCLADNEPRTSGSKGLDVVRVLAAAQRSLDGNGIPISI